MFWEPFGIPTTANSNIRPQFVCKCWRKMRARLGIHQAFSQPHRSRANGRAERAGQQLLSCLQKLHVSEGLNWVEALPRALKLHHDVVGEGGHSPYHILCGRTDCSQAFLKHQPGCVSMPWHLSPGWSLLTSKLMKP